MAWLVLPGDGTWRRSHEAVEGLMAGSKGTGGSASARREGAGRAPRIPRVRHGEWSPGQLPTTPVDLSPTPKKLLEAARRVLEKKGYAGLRLEAVAKEAGLAHSLIRYHFGSKAGLVGVLIDWLLYETYVEMHKGMTSLPPEDTHGRLRAMTHGLRRLFCDIPSYRLYLDLVVAAIHDDGLRLRLADSFVGQRRLIQEALEAPSNGNSRERADALSAIVVAFSDGLAMQYLADPDGIDLDRIFEIWDHMVDLATLPSASADRSDCPARSRLARRTLLALSPAP